MNCAETVKSHLVQDGGKGGWEVSVQQSQGKLLELVSGRGESGLGF